VKCRASWVLVYWLVAWAVVLPLVWAQWQQAHFCWAMTITTAAQLQVAAARVVWLVVLNPLAMALKKHPWHQ
jgi:hypothetical protein